MKKVSCFISILALFCISTSAQSPYAKFGSPSKSDFEYSLCPIDSGADAYFIFDYANIHFDYSTDRGWTWQMDKHTKIRIVNDNGKKLANFIIAYHKKASGRESVHSIKGYTYNIVDGKVQKTKLSEDQIFTVDITDFNKQKQIVMPKVKAGSVIEISYTMDSDMWAIIPNWEFQKNIPVMRSELFIGLPEYFRYKMLIKGYEPLSVNENLKDTSSATFKWSVFYVQKTQLIKYVVNISHLVAENVPALKKEPFINTIENYRSGIEFEVDFIDYPGQTDRIFTASWEEIAENLLNLEKFKLKLKHTGFARSIIKNIVRKYPNPTDRMTAIYDIVKTQVKWDGSYDVLSPYSLRDVFNKKNGGAMDINFILISLLRTAGIQAYPVVLSTRENGVILPKFPSVKKLNYIIGMAIIDGKQILLDATDPYRPAGVLPVRCINGKGIVVDRDLHTWVDLISPVTELRKGLF